MGKLRTSRGRAALAAAAGLACVVALGIAPGIYAWDNPGGKIIVEKQTDPDGDQTSFEFVLKKPNGQEKTFSLRDGEERLTGALEPGTYSVSESVPSGWMLTSASCSDGSSPGSIEISEGEVVKCVFENKKNPPPPDEPGRLVLEKQTDPDGDPTAFQLTWTKPNGTVATVTIHDDEHPGFRADVGTHSVSENVPEGWTLTSATCSDGSPPSAIVISSGETVTCTFNNKKNPPPPPEDKGKIIVEKQTNPDGAEQEFDFEFDEEEGFELSDGEQETFDNLSPGTYSVSESVPSGWTLTSATCSDGSAPSAIALSAGETVKCTFVNTRKDSIDRPSSINVSKSANPTTLKEPGGLVTYSVSITNTSPELKVTILEVFDDRFGDLDDEGGRGCFDVPINMNPGATVNCQFTAEITGAGGTSHINVVTARGVDEEGDAVSDSDDARVDITPRVIDLVVVKDATSPTPLNGIVTYTMTVTNKGPDTATNVQLADPAPTGITYLTAAPSQGTCSVAPALITCSLGTIAPAQTVTITVTARATQVGSFTNTATVTGSGGGEANPADNLDSATTEVTAPLVPPKPQPKPKPKPKPADVCVVLTVTPKLIRADGKPDRIAVRVTVGKKSVRGVKVLVTGKGIRKTARTNRKGMAVLTVNATNAGLITVTTLGRDSCGPKRIGVVGIFLPPVTG